MSLETKSSISKHSSKDRLDLVPILSIFIPFIQSNFCFYFSLLFFPYKFLSLFFFPISKISTVEIEKVDNVNSDIEM